jgi:hypothetical protein
LQSGFVEFEPIAAILHQETAYLRWRDPVGKSEPFDFKGIGDRSYVSPLEDRIDLFSPHVNDLVYAIFSPFF